MAKPLPLLIFNYRIGSKKGSQSDCKIFNSTQVDLYFLAWDVKRGLTGTFQETLPLAFSGCATKQVVYDSGLLVSITIQINAWLQNRIFHLNSEVLFNQLLF